MPGSLLERRRFLEGLGAAGFACAMPSAFIPQAHGSIVHEVASGAQIAATVPKDRIKFGVCGISHDHVIGMTNAIKRGGGTLTKVWGGEPDKVAAFQKRFPEAKVVKTQQEVIDDPAIQLVLSSQIANERAPLGVKVMRAGKDYLSDKPGITTLEQLADVRKAIAETHKIYGILYSERLEVPAAVKAGELIQQGAIGHVIQTINIAPHQIVQGTGSTAGSTGPNGGRPDWFWNDVQYGGILCDIGSHQVDQFLFYTGSKKVEIVASQVANVRHPEHPHFQDFGDMMLRGENGFGYVRLDWFTPNGLGTWGDGRLFILGTDGYIEVRKYTNVAVDKKGNNLYIVAKDQAPRYIDCNNVPLPFGPQFVSDVVNRTHTAQDQVETLLAAELSIRAQMKATRAHLDWESKA